MVSFGGRQTGLVVGLVGGSHVINHMYFILLPPVTEALATDLPGVGVAQVGLAIGVLGLVVTALQLPFGHLSDTRGRTVVLAISLVFGTLGAALTATAQSYAWLLGSQVVLGVGVAAHHPAHYPLLSAATDPDLRGRALSVHGFTGAVGYAAPPAIVAGASVLGFGWRVAIGAITVVGALYAAGCLFAVHRYVDDDITAPSDTTRADENWSRARLRALPGRALASLRGMLAARGIVLLTVLWLVTSTAAWGVKTQTVPLLTTNYGLAPAAANLVVAAMFALGAVLMFGGGWLTDRIDPGPVLLLGYVAFAGITAMLATGLVPVVAAVGLTLLLSTAIDSSRPARSTLGDRLSPADSVGKSFGLLTIGISGGGAIAPPLLGFLSATVGVGAAFAAMAALGLVALALTAVVLRVEDDDPVASAAPGDD